MVVCVYVYNIPMPEDKVWHMVGIFKMLSDIKFLRDIKRLLISLLQFLLLFATGAIFSNERFNELIFQITIGKILFIFSLVHSKYLLSNHYVPGTVLFAGDIK